MMSSPSDDAVGWRIFEQPGVCRLALAAGGAGLRCIRFEGTLPENARIADAGNAVLNAAEEQLGRYFAGELREFRIPLDPRGTEFQMRVWRELCAIPFGETRSYGQIAQALGQPKAVRAVGAANGQNPIPIVVPCHRVIGANGKLVGFGGGLEMKRRLLAIEQPNYGFWS